MLCYDAEKAKLRSLIYYAFSKLVDYPYDDSIDKLPLLVRDTIVLIKSLLDSLGAPTKDKLVKVVNELKSCQKMFEKELNKLGRDMFQAEYVSLFELGTPEPPCPLREIAFREKEGSLEIKHIIPNTMITTPGLLLLLNLEEQYRSEGLEYQKYPPDHLVVELEYMHYLVTKEYKLLAEGKIKDATNIAKKEKAFLRAHLEWVDKLRGCVESRSRLNFYKHVLKALALWLDFDKEILEYIVCQD
ncbi:MAG TPA: hypothetical protein EYH59_04485 [Pyrodictium sp.]|nr:hypothetical protein [Pyrodictium sp.]